ncbi:MAG TPA: phosphatase PAP2 family protein [Candidatus Baltobacteraceae bacterium]|nr:phosphatase PAP2 family protein [Candidatus Baltobacteraceae bacterium]
MRIFFYRLLKNLYACFSGHLLSHAWAIALTYIAVTSGFDWWWYESAQGIPRTFLYPAMLLGSLLPIVLPFVLLAIGEIRKDARVKLAAGALGQSAFLGWLISSAYKAVTGRAHPMFGTVLTHDISRDFQFGFLRGGIFWGWPSSHTTVAFAMAAALATLYRGKASITYPALLYALYVGLAVSISIHWFSDFLAGAIIGTVIGVVVGRSFRER